MYGVDSITWISNPPSASHTSGFWERQIRPAKGFVKALVKAHRQILTNESLYTLLVEIEAIIKSRPMTTETISEVKSDISL